MRSSPTSSRGGLWRRLLGSRKGNIALIAAFMMVPLTFAMGMAVDFTMSQSRKDQLDGVADAAALGGVTPSEMAQSWTTASTQSTSLFNGQSAVVAGVSALSVKITGQDDTVGTKITRTITVTYTGKSQNIFASLLGMATLPISGTSTATATTAPNIDFYLMLDTSPSMEIAATSSGMTALENDTQLTAEGTCAFGCHQSNPADLTGSTTSCNPHTDPATGHSTAQCQYLTPSLRPVPCTTSGAYADGTSFTASSTFPEAGRDFYDLSRCLDVTLRIDLLNTAAQNLMTTAGSMATTYKTTYRMALYLTNMNQATAANDLNLYTLQSLTSNLTLAKTQAATITALEMYQNNHLVSGDSNGDMDTLLDTDVVGMNTLMPAPGNGTNNKGDKPQEVLFIVTDGLNDIPNRSYPPIDWNGTNCAAIKSRGIRIAVLYTTYVPFAGWYMSNVLPSLPTGLPPDLPTSTPVGTDAIALAAQQCASPGLYYEVSTDGDISAALQTLFQEAVATARLSQ
ncbi:MAG TPA: Tad domain-containing protein [Caulobacteraceae bacterium]|jgi:Flp pilus assembly protein TadG